MNPHVMRVRSYDTVRTRRSARTRDLPSSRGSGHGWSILYDLSNSAFPYFVAEDHKYYALALVDMNLGVKSTLKDTHAIVQAAATAFTSSLDVFAQPSRGEQIQVTDHIDASRPSAVASHDIRSEARVAPYPV